MGRHPAEPEGDVLGRLQSRQVPVQLEKHILRELLGRGSILEEVKGDAEHHPLMPPHQVVELEPNRFAGVGRLRTLGCQARASILLGTYTRREGLEDAEISM